MSTSIFGGAAPKFIGNFGTEAAATVLLNHWVTDEAAYDVKEVVVESELAAERAILSRGEYFTFSGTINLFRYGTMAEIRAKFEEIYAYHNQDVVLYPHRDGAALVDSAGDEVLFRLTVTAKHLNRLDYKDLLVLKFRSLKAVDLSDASVTFPAVSTISMT